MRAFSLKSLCLLAGFVVPCLEPVPRPRPASFPGSITRFSGMAGAITTAVTAGAPTPSVMARWVMAADTATVPPAIRRTPLLTATLVICAAPSSCGCSTGISSAPMMSAPNYSTPTPANSTPSNSTPGSDELPTEPTKTYYQPSAGYYDYYTGYTPAYVVDSGKSRRVPCTSCGGGDCATTPSVKSAKPETQPTPAGPDKKDPKEDDFKGTQEGAGKGTGANTGSGYSPGEANDVLPNKLPVNENTPARRPGPAGEVGTDSGELEPPVKDDSSPDEGLREQGERLHRIAVSLSATTPRSSDRRSPSPLRSLASFVQSGHREP